MNNHFVIRNFISEEEGLLIKKFVDGLETSNLEISNPHINEVHGELNGYSWIYDITKTEVSSYISTFQSSDNVLDGYELPQIFFTIKDRISAKLRIPDNNVFLQIIKQDCGGRIKKHYDTGYPSYINYKCNIAIQSESEYDLFIEEDKLTINQSDLYCFEASLYKHWTEQFKEERILLSYAFGLKYSDLGRVEDDPRCRMSRRMVKYFQKL